MHIHRRRTIAAIAATTRLPPSACVDAVAGRAAGGVSPLIDEARPLACDQEMSLRDHLPVPAARRRSAGLVLLAAIALAGPASTAGAVGTAGTAGVIRSVTVDAVEPDTGDGCDTRYCADDAVFQVAPLQGLVAGVLESPFTFADVLAHGDFGLGGMSPLDGEAIVVDGRAWHARLDGTLREVAPDERASVLFAKRFRADRRVPLADIADLGALTSALDAALTDRNGFHAIRIDGRFARLTLRSVPPQSPPYRSVNEVVGDQRLLELADVDGTLVGFRFPAYVGGINAPGYHFHFVDRARRHGGHLLALAAYGLEAQVDASRALTLVVADDPAFDAADLGGGDGFDRALHPGVAPATGR